MVQQGAYSVLSFFCGSPCCPNGLVCESRIDAQVCEANLMSCERASKRITSYIAIRVRKEIEVMSNAPKGGEPL